MAVNRPWLPGYLGPHAAALHAWDACRKVGWSEDVLAVQVGLRDAVDDGNRLAALVDGNSLRHLRTAYAAAERLQRSKPSLISTSPSVRHPAATAASSSQCKHAGGDCLPRTSPA